MDPIAFCFSNLLKSSLFSGFHFNLFLICDWNLLEEYSSDSIYAIGFRFYVIIK